MAVREIIDYLNSQLGTKFRHETTSTRKHIKARLKDGYTIADFKKVIDYKKKEWLNTEMSKYLVPDTLFGKRFEKYINQATALKNNVSVDYGSSDQTVYNSMMARKQQEINDYFRGGLS
ncbi:conserved phage C-terminal domain-containing protein [Listeria fleischmannii]|uniref:Phage replication initiation protein n=1 Tax=Listeria fleischmannii FSL S10-1203 TaxID=1265822 RepID=W7DM87_9LIST|nr:conserved phage C-terminal domain-containing protein [Listeria fleischmannii]EUJ56440.1 phage replication initiation protein [Listeria fleischmannii FSL S10-1203]